MTVKRVVVGFALAMGLSPVAAAEPFRVQIDRTIPLKLSAPANSVVIGNATVADVTVHDATTLLVTGKAFGSTNLIVLDRAGRTIYSNQLSVAGDSTGELTVVRGGGVSTYSCIDKCRATPMVGDDPEHFGRVMSTVSGKESSASGN